MRYLKYLILIIALCLPSMAQMGEHRKIFTIAGATSSFVQGIQCFHNFNGSAVCTQTYTSNVTAGNLLIVICTNYSGNTMGTMAASDTQGNIYTQRLNTGISVINNNSETWLFTAIAGSSAADTVTCTTNAGHEGNYRGALLEYTTVNTVDGTPAGGNAVQTTGVTNSTTTASTDVLFTYGYVETGGTSAQSVFTPAGFTRDYLDANGNVAVFRKNSVASGVQSVKVISTGTDFIHVGLIPLH